MYSTCLFCKRRLGRNESIEHCPVGRGLAFDSAKGRLWVICPHCARWNLTPIESRWEAVEEAERLYGTRRVRAQSEHIGMTTLPDGTNLVRIGPALRPEFASWRYGRVFQSRLRRRTAALGTGAIVVGAGAAVAGAPLASAIAALPAVWILAAHMLLPAIALRGRLHATRVMGEHGRVLRVTRADLEHAELLEGDEKRTWAVRFRHSYGTVQLKGERAQRALGAILARVNRAGAGTRTVRDATALLADASTPQRMAALVASEMRARAGSFAEEHAAYRRGDWLAEPLSQSVSRKSFTRGQEPVNRGALPRLPAPLRLALEMALHEDTERAALEGELALLEAAWREAEEIASIADNLLTPIP